MSYPYDIPVAFSFRVVIGTLTGLAECSFQDVSGLNVSFDTESINEGGNNQFAWKLPTRTKYDNIVLKRGIAKNSALVAVWINLAIQQYIINPATVTISLLNEQGLPVISWLVANAYPVSVKISEFKASESSLVFETLELSYNYFTRIG